MISSRELGGEKSWTAIDLMKEGVERRNGKSFGFGIQVIG